VIEVLHEDDGLLVVNKPAGLLAVPDRYDKTKPNLYTMLQAERPGQWLANVHRLDFNTSGVFICAKSPENFRQVAQQFSERETRKVYVAVVQGLPEEQTIDLPIGERLDRPGRARIDRRGGEARSIVRIRERFRGFTLIEVQIVTGRMHQIRVHMQAVDCPLVGDVDYGGAPLLLSQIKRNYKPKETEKPLLARPALHAESLTLREPAQTFTAPWPKDLTVAVKYLRKYAG
jgi:23S rRNA pseudouridine1911/1915/1917 synthase